MPASRPPRVQTAPRPRGAPPWTETLDLPDGRHMLLRPIAPQDDIVLREGFATLSPEEVRMRFMHPMRELTPEMAQRLTRLDPRREFALVVAEPFPPGEGLVGAVARTSIDDDGRCAEFALLVARQLSGQGLGTYLLRKLIEWARRRRLQCLYGNVLVENVAMLRIADALGFRCRPLAGEPGVLRVELPLRDEAPPKAGRRAAANRGG